MCIRVQFAPRHEISDPWDATRHVIIVSDDLDTTALFALLAVRAILRRIGIPQDHFGALCWCGDEIDLTAAHTSQQQQNEVTPVHNTQAPATAGRHHAA